MRFTDDSRHVFNETHQFIVATPGWENVIRESNMFKPQRLLCFAALLLGVVTIRAFPSAVEGGTEAAVLVEHWLATQTNLTSWSADFVQTRHLAALTQPLSKSGKLWFKAPDKFRWELGNPPQSIAFRTKDDLWVLAPRLKRAERYSIQALAAGPMRDALSLLDTGFPRDAAEFRRKFELLGVNPDATGSGVRFRPRDAALRKLVPDIMIVVSPGDFSLTATELHFVDGTWVRNDFKDAKRNPEMDDADLSPVIDPNWRVSEPLKGGKTGAPKK